MSDPGTRLRSVAATVWTPERRAAYRLRALERIVNGTWMNQSRRFLEVQQSPEHRAKLRAGALGLGNPNALPLGTRRLTTGRPDGSNRYVRIKVEDDLGIRWMAEHRWAMEQSLGRHLADDEVVHHIDGNTLNNVIENLELMTDAEHRALHTRAHQ
jgi:hypothetical protein